MSDHPRIFWTADRSTLVEEGDVRAAFLAYAASDPIPPEHRITLAEQRSDDIEHALYGTEDDPEPEPAPKPPAAKRAARMKV